MQNLMILCKITLLLVAAYSRYGKCLTPSVWLLNKDYKQLEYCKRDRPVFVCLTFSGKAVDILDVDSENITRTFNLTKYAHVHSLAVSLDCKRVVATTDTGIINLSIDGAQKDIVSYQTPLRGSALLSQWQLLLGRREDIGYAIRPLGRDGNLIYCVNTSSGSWQPADFPKRTNRRLISSAPLYATLHPTRDWLYLASWQTVFKFKLTDKCVQFDYSIRQTGQSLHTSKWFYSYEGNQVFLSSGKVVNISGNASTDIVVSGQFSEEIRGVSPRRDLGGWFDQMHKSPNAIYRIKPNDPNITAYSWPYLGKYGMLAVPRPKKSIAVYPMQVRVDDMNGMLYTVAEYVIQGGVNMVLGIGKLPLEVPTPPTVPLDLGVMFNHDGASLWLFESVYDQYEFCSHNTSYVVALRGTDVIFLEPRRRLTHRTFKMPLEGLAMMVSRDCLNIAVAHHSYLSIINITATSAAEAVNTIRTDIVSAKSVVYAPNGMVYVFSNQIYWNEVKCVNLTDQSITDCTNCGRSPGFNAFLHPQGSWIYTITNGVWQTVYRYSTRVGAGMCLNRQTQSSRATYGDDMWFSADGSRIFLNTGKVLSSHELSQKGAVSEQLHKQHYLWVESSPRPPNSVYILEKDKQWINVLSWPTLQYNGSLTFPRPSKCSSVFPLRIHLCKGGNHLITLARYQMGSKRYTGISYSNLTDTQSEANVKAAVTHNRLTCADATTPSIVKTTKATSHITHRPPSSSTRQPTQESTSRITPSDALPTASPTTHTDKYCHTGDRLACFRPLLVALNGMHDWPIAPAFSAYRMRDYCKMYKQFRLCSKPWTVMCSASWTSHFVGIDDFYDYLCVTNQTGFLLYGDCYTASDELRDKELSCRAIYDDAKSAATKNSSTSDDKYCQITNGFLDCVHDNTADSCGEKAAKWRRALYASTLNSDLRAHNCMAKKSNDGQQGDGAITDKVNSGDVSTHLISGVVFVVVIALVLSIVAFFTVRAKRGNKEIEIPLAENEIHDASIEGPRAKATFSASEQDIKLEGINNPLYQQNHPHLAAKFESNENGNVVRPDASSQ